MLVAEVEVCRPPPGLHGQEMSGFVVAQRAPGGNGTAFLACWKRLARQGLVDELREADLRPLAFETSPTAYDARRGEFFSRFLGGAGVSGVVGNFQGVTST